MATAALKSLFKKLCQLKKSPASTSLPVKDSRITSPSSHTSSSSAPSSPIRSGWLEEDLRRVFAYYDSNSDGKISHEELEAMVRAMGSMKATKPDDHDTDFKAEAAAMMEVADLDGDGYIDFHEFVACISPKGLLDSGPKDTRQYSSHYDDQEEVLNLAYAVYDQNGDGVITAEELHHVLRRVMPDGNTKTLADCQSMIMAVDRKGDGVVCFREFTTLMRADVINCQ